MSLTHNDKSPDSSDRIEDFLLRHGGPAARRGDAGDTVAGISGWSEVYAADGYILRCEWSRFGGRQEMKFTEKHPAPRLDKTQELVDFGL